MYFPNWMCNLRRACSGCSFSACRPQCRCCAFVRCLRVNYAGYSWREQSMYFSNYFVNGNNFKEPSEERFASEQPVKNLQSSFPLTPCQVLLPLPTGRSGELLVPHWICVAAIIVADSDRVGVQWILGIVRGRCNSFAICVQYIGTICFDGELCGDKETSNVWHGSWKESTQGMRDGLRWKIEGEGCNFMMGNVLERQFRSRAGGWL